jgi:hypothetical protein
MISDVLRNRNHRDVHRHDGPPCTLARDALVRDALVRDALAHDAPSQ